MQVDDSEDDWFSLADIEQVDELLNYNESTQDDFSNDADDDVTVQSTASSTGSSSPNEQHVPGEYHRFDRMTRDETASYKIMALLDAAGAPRICYNRLVALLKKLIKNDGFDVKKALNRETMRLYLKGFKASLLQLGRSTSYGILHG